MLLRATILCLAALPLSALAQVQSIKLGIDVNSPYGLSEPWFTIRSALLRCDEIETVAERPDVKASTAVVTPKQGKLPNPAKLEKAIADSGAGARLRSVGLTAEGELIRKADKLQLRLPDRCIFLRGLTEPGQQHDPKRRWRVTGLLRWTPELVLEARAFEQVKTK